MIIDGVRKEAEYRILVGRDIEQGGKKDCREELRRRGYKGRSRG